MALGKKPQINSTRIELLDASGAKTNVFFDIESANNARAVAASRDTDLDALFAANIKDHEHPTDEENRAFIKAKMRASAAIMAACVTGWEWNGEEFLAGEGSPEFTPEEVLRILSAPVEGIDILGQVTAAVNDLGKPKPAPKKA
jgi:hypothetical protein